MEAYGSVKESGPGPVGERHRAAMRRLGERLASIPDLVLEPAADLARRTTLRIGGPAELLVVATNEPALERLLAEAKAAGERPLVLGQGSNVLVPDAGIAGLVLRLGGDFERFRIDGTRVRAGAAVSLPRLAQELARQGVVGLEALAGFPSSVGGAVYMNAGCYGTEVRDVVEEVRVLDPELGWRELSVTDLEAGYRTTALQGSGKIVTAATFRLAEGDAAAALERIRELNRRRWSSLPSGKPLAGSIFRNPPGDHAGRLIEQCGLKGRRRGEAEISPKHANVIVNLGKARAEDVLELMVEAWHAVRERYGIELRPEIELLGGLRSAWQSRTTAVVAESGGRRE